MKLLGFIASLFGATSPAADTKQVDPKSILFSTPTLNNALPAFQPPAQTGQNLFQLHEDDWRQFEAISDSNLPAIEQELTAIREVHATAGVKTKAGDRELTAYRRIHVRKLITNPVEKGLQLSEVAALSDASTSFDGVSLSGSSPVIGGFAFPISNLVVYGQADGERVLSLCFSFSGNFQVTTETAGKLAALLEEHHLRVVHWPSASVVDFRTREEGNSVASKEAKDRRDRSVRRLEQEAVPTIAHLPVIENSTSATSRTKDEIAKRAIAICITAVKGEGLDQDTVASLVKRYGAEGFFSPQERAFIENPQPSQQERVQFSWRYECFWVLLWSLGYVEKLERPDRICDVPTAVAILRDRSTTQFIADAKLRPIAQILDEADLIYRYNWAVVNARVKGEGVPANLEAGVVQERHYVLNWLIGYMGQDWDDISTDT